MSTATEQENASATSPSATSPFICLSIQCDMLYRVGALPHRFAFISEQSVYTRAVEQLRYATPSPNLLPGVSERFTGSDAATPCKRADDGANSLLPHVYMSSQTPHPFPFIDHFESAQEAVREQEERRAKAHHRSSMAPVKGSGEAGKTPSTECRGLVPSGPLLAQRTYRHDFEYRAREMHSDTTAAAPHGGTAEQTVSSLLKDSSPFASPSLQLMFPSPVLLRAVAQMVLAMQVSSSTSAARFALAQYRGVQLLPWRSLNEAQESAAPSAPRLPPEAVVFSVLPQVVVDQAASRARATSGQHRCSHSLSVEEKDSATLYALTPFSGLHTQLRTQGAKRAREEAQGVAQDGAAVNPTTVAVVAGAMLCERLAMTTEASAAQSISVRYAAVTADSFERWVPRSGGEPSPSPTPSVALCVAEPLLYEEESTWMTNGVYRPLFSLPLAPPTETSAVSGADAPTAENGSSGQSALHATFVKTSAFLFLSFLVHHSWCVHVHSAVTQALAAHWPPLRIEQQTGSAGLAFTGSHVTCLPPVQEVRRSPQYEWKSTLVYRAYGKQAPGSIATPSLRHGLVLWQLTILVVNRKAHLQWSMCSASPAAFAGADSAAVSLRPDEYEGILDGSGFLDDLLQQLQSCQLLL